MRRRTLTLSVATCTVSVHHSLDGMPQTNTSDLLNRRRLLGLLSLPVVLKLKCIGAHYSATSDATSGLLDTPNMLEM